MPAERASAQLFANVLRDSLGSSRREDTDLLLPRVDLGQLLPEPAGQWLQAHGAQIRLGTASARSRKLENGIAIDGETFSAAIIATAPQHVGALWPAAATDYAYEPIATVYRNFVPKMKSRFPAEQPPRRPLPVGCRPWSSCARLRPERTWATWEKPRRRSAGRRCSTPNSASPSRLAAGTRVIREKRATFCGHSRPAPPRLHDIQPAPFPGRRLHLGRLPGDARRCRAQRPARRAMAMRALTNA